MKILRSWREQKIMLKWRFPNLSDEDFQDPDKEVFVKRLQEKLGKTKSDVLKLIGEA